MKRLIALVVAAGCGGKPDPTVHDIGSGSSIDNSAPSESDSTMAVVERAFEGHRPSFPVLSKDGNVAAVEIVTPLVTGGSMYSVAFVTANTDAWSGTGEVVTLVDAKLVHLLLNADGTPAIDIATITKAARGVNDRIAAGGFSRLEGSVEAVRLGDATKPEAVRVGPFELRVTDEDQAMKIRAYDGTTQFVLDQIDRVPMGLVGTEECIAVPVPKRAWFDTAKKRLLLQVGWDAGSAQCDVPDERFRLYGPR